MSEKITVRSKGGKNPVFPKLDRQKTVIILVLAVLFLFFYIASPNFRRNTTIVNILDYSYYITLLAIGVTFPLITGGVDLSIGTGMMCYAVVGAYMIKNLGVPTWVAMITAILMGLIMGTVNGSIIAFMQLPPFLVTLCTCMITRGLGSVITGGFGNAWPIASSDQGWFRSIFKITVGKNTKIPVGFVLIIICVVIMSFVLNHTKVGRYTIAIGSNRESVKLSGVNVKKYLIIPYAISGLFAGFAAIAYAAVFATMLPGTGAGFELEAMGYSTIELLVKAANGEEISDLPADGAWYNADNMDDPSIAPNLYD